MSVEPSGAGVLPRPGGRSSDARKMMVGCAACCGLLALACLAGAAGLVAQPPSPGQSFQPIMLQFANLRLSIDVTDNPDCPPMIVGCLVMPRPNQLYLSAWSSLDRKTPSGIERTSHLMLRLRLR